MVWNKNVLLLTGFHACRGFPPYIPLPLIPFLTWCAGRHCTHRTKSVPCRFYLYFTLKELNSAIQGFPYKFSDNTNRPQKVPSTFKRNRTLGGNGHENLSLVCFRPLIISHCVPEGNQTWELVLQLKDLVELLSTSYFTLDSPCYLQSKISDHRQLLLTVFLYKKLHPKNHFIEH